MELDNEELKATKELNKNKFNNYKILNIKKEKTSKELFEELKIIEDDRDYWKLRFEELNKQWNRVIDNILGKGYYNIGCAWNICDKLTADDLIWEFTRLKKKWWKFWK